MPQLSKFSRQAIQTEIDAGDSELKRLKEFEKQSRDWLGELNWRMKACIELTTWTENLTENDFRQLKAGTDDLQDKINKEEKKIENAERLQALHLIIKRAEETIDDLGKDPGHNARLIERKREEIKRREIKQCDVLLELVGGQIEVLERQLKEAEKSGNSSESHLDVSQLREEMKKGEGHIESLREKRAVLSGELSVEKQAGATSDSQSSPLPSILSGTGSPFSPASKVTEGKFSSSSNPSSAQKSEESDSDDDILPGGYRGF